MGIELAAQRLDLGFPRQRARLGRAPLSLARTLHRQRAIMQPGGEQIEQHAHAEQQRQVAVQPLLQARQFPGLRHCRRRHPRAAHQHQAARHRCHPKRDRQAEPTVGPQGQRAADIPGRQAGESIHQARRRQHRGGVHPGHPARRPHDVHQQGQQRDPCQKVQHQAARRFQKRVHGGSVLERHAAENCRSPHDQVLHIGAGRRMHGVVDKAAENAAGAHLQVPACRDAHGGAAV